MSDKLTPSKIKNFKRMEHKIKIVRQTKKSVRQVQKFQGRDTQNQSKANSFQNFRK